MRPYYAEYAKHAMRYYSKFILNASSEQPRFKTESDKKNWFACQSALKSFTDEERDILIRLYLTDDTLPENINDLAKRDGIRTDRLWGLVNDLERKFAKRRGLIG